MPLAKIQVVEGRYHETWITKVLGAVQAASMNTISERALSSHSVFYRHAGCALRCEGQRQSDWARGRRSLLHEKPTTVNVQEVRPCHS